MIGSWVVLQSALLLATPSGDADGLLRLPTCGIAFSPPRGWQRILNDKPKTIAQWIGPGSTPDKLRSLVKIEGGKPTASLEKSAEDMARQWGGSVEHETTILDNERTFRIRGRSDGKTLRPLVGLVAYHNELIYLVMGGAAPGGSCETEVEAIRKSWKWIPFESLSKHTNLDPFPTSACGGSFLIHLPALIHVDPSDHPERVLDLAISNIRRGEPDFLAYVQLIPKQASFSQMKGPFLANLQTQITFKQVPVWEERHGTLPAVVTQACDVELQKQVHTIKWALIDLDEKRVVLINFTLDVKTQEERQVLDDLAGRMVDSITRPPKSP